VGSEEWVVKFGSLAIIDRVWKFTAYKANEHRMDEENLFWSPLLPGFVAVSRNDVPAPVLARVEDWIKTTVRRAQ
jgi:hypothetical protein